MSTKYPTYVYRPDDDGRSRRCPCDECQRKRARDAYYSTAAQLRERTVERDAARDRIAQLERDLARALATTSDYACRYHPRRHCPLGRPLQRLHEDLDNLTRQYDEALENERVARVTNDELGRIVRTLQGKLSAERAKLADVEWLAKNGLGFTGPQPTPGGETTHYRTAMYAILERLDAEAQPAVRVTPNEPGPCSVAGAACPGSCTRVDFTVTVIGASGGGGGSGTRSDPGLPGPCVPVVDRAVRCTGAGNALCEDVVRMVWRGASLYVEGEEDCRPSACASNGDWVVFAGPDTPTIAGVRIKFVRMWQRGAMGLANNRRAVEKAIMRQVHAAKPWVRFAFEGGEP